MFPKYNPKGHLDYAEELSNRRRLFLELSLTTKLFGSFFPPLTVVVIFTGAVRGR